jgi:DNA-binding FrmR family transcriptional regulator
MATTMRPASAGILRWQRRALSSAYDALLTLFNSTWLTALLGSPQLVASSLQVRCKKRHSNVDIVYPGILLALRSSALSHTVREKSKLLNRVSRLRGQIEAIERALEREVECAEVLQLIASARGAMNGLMAEVMEDHIRAHVLDPEHGHDSERMRGAEELIDVVRAYLK